MPTKAQLEEQNAELQRQILEAKRQQTKVPVRIESEAEGSHAIDHLTMMDNHEAPDTNREPAEDIAERENSDLSFWNNSWTWVEATTSYGDKPQDKWFINPTAKLVGEVIQGTPLVFGACEVKLMAGEHKQQLEDERERHLNFLRSADQNELISESLDLLTAYQARFIESVQRYLGLQASYEYKVNSNNADEESIEQAQMNKEAAAAQCRGWAARLIALREAYHETVTDDRAYNLTFNFAPVPPAKGKPASREYSIFRWVVSTTLNKVGRRLANSIKSGKMDAERYRIPRPWLTGERKTVQLDANTMLSDFG